MYSGKRDKDQDKCVFNNNWWLGLPVAKQRSGQLSIRPGTMSKRTQCKGRAAAFSLAKGTDRMLARQGMLCDGEHLVANFISNQDTEHRLPLLSIIQLARSGRILLAQSLRN